MINLHIIYKVNLWILTEDFDEEKKNKMRVGVVGINHKLADLKLRETLAKACHKRFGPFQSIQGEHVFVLLSTCNRTEIYFCSDDLTATHTHLLAILRLDVEQEFDHKLYSYFGLDCFKHLARVAAGLDSAIIGETEIQRQVKLAYEATSTNYSLPHDMHFLFQKSLGIAKKIRFELQLGRGMPNLEHAIFQTGHHFFEKPKEANILFVGASEINEKILSFLLMKQFHQITLCNRSISQSERWGNDYNIPFISWDQFREWESFDWIIFGTKSPDYLITQDQLSLKNKNKKLIMDLCVPRNVDPKVGKNPFITLMNIDQINRLLKIRHRRMNHGLIEAEQKITQSAAEQTFRFRKKISGKSDCLAIIA